MRLELVPLPSRDVERSKAFYVEQVGFVLDHDVEPGNGMRIVQLTPPGSACSVVVGVGIGDPEAPPVQHLHLVVDDAAAARDELVGRGVEVSEVHDMGGVRYAYFSDPDGNSWALQEIGVRTPEAEREGSDRTAIAAVVAQFFDAFTSGPDVAARLEALREVMLPGAVVVRTCGDPPQLLDVDGFIAPRQALLSDGTLTDFREWELAGRTDVFGDVAAHWCRYAKAWRQDGAEHTGQGSKTIQLVRTSTGWRISAVAWDDEREGARPGG